MCVCDIYIYIALSFKVSLIIPSIPLLSLGEASARPYLSAYLPGDPRGLFERLSFTAKSAYRRGTVDHVTPLLPPLVIESLSSVMSYLGCVARFWLGMSLSFWVMGWRQGQQGGPEPESWDGSKHWDLLFGFYIKVWATNLLMDPQDMLCDEESLSCIDVPNARKFN